MVLLLVGGGAAQGAVRADSQTAVPAAPHASPVVVPRPSVRAMRYHRTGNQLWIVQTLWGLVVPAALLFTGFSAKMRDIARRTGRNWFFTVAVYGVLFTLISWGLDLPFAYYLGFVRPHEYGLSAQTFSKWRDDQLKALVLSLVAIAAVLWIPYLLLRRSPRRWWLYTTLAFIPLLTFLIVVQPVYVDPLFNRFERLYDSALEHDILALAARAGIEGGRVYQVNKSVDTNTVNAYVTGLGATRRIVLWDTLLRRLDRGEVLFVMAHEMGHYVLGHMLRTLLLASLLTLICLFAVHRSAGWMIQRFRRRFGFDDLADVASLPLLVLVVNLVSIAVLPAVNAYVRHLEHEADRFGLELTRDNHAAATAFVKLQSNTLSVPYPGLLYQLWRGNHPSLGERIEFANDYRPWESGQALRYGHHIDRAAPH